MNKRFKIKQIVESNTFETIILIIIFINSILVIIGFFNIPEDTLAIIDQVESFFIIIYILEALLKIIGLGHQAYFRDNWNKFDFSLIIISLSTSFALSFFRFVRNVRTVRATRLVRTTRVNRTARTIRCFKVAIKIISDHGMV